MNSLSLRPPTVFVFAALLIGSFTSTGRAANWYVDAAATGSHNGTSQANAWTSFAQIAQASLSGGDVVWIQSGTYDERYNIAKSGTSTSARITYVGIGPTRPVLRGILSSGFDYIGVLNLEFTHPNTSYNYACIQFNSGCDGWLIQDNYFHDTVSGGIELHTTPCNNTIIRHNTFNNINWIGLGAQNGNTITLNGDNNLCEYNTIGVSLDRIYIAAGTKVIARNNYFTAVDVAAFTATTVFPFHEDGLQGGLNNGFPIVQQVLWERNLNVDQKETVGGNSHGFTFQDDQTVPTANWFVDRFNILVRPDGGSHIFQQLLSFYNYNNTYVGIDSHGVAGHDPAIFWGPGVGSAPLPEGVSTWLNNTWSLSPSLLLNAGGIFDTASVTFPTSFSSDYQHSWNSGSVGGLLPTAPHNLGHVNPRFTDSASDDYTLQSGSPLKAAGGPVTTANGAGSSSTTLTVVEAKRLFDGWGIADADWIKIGAGAYVQISSINYSTNVVTLSAARTWSNGDAVIVKGMEDIGALPYAYTQSFAVTNTTPFGPITAGPATLTATCPNPDAVRMVEFLVDGLPVGIAYASPYSVSWTSDGLLHNIEARAYNAWASRTPTARSTNTFITNPASQTVLAGVTVNFSVTANGTILSYRWQKNGVPLSDGGIVSGAATASLTLTGVSATDAANYSVVATNAVGPAVSGDAELDLATLPAITANPSPSSQLVAPGATVVYTAAASGIPTPAFQWQKDGVPLSDGGVVSGSGTATLTLTGVSTLDTGTYTVVATNVAGSSPASSGAVLTVAVLPSFTTQPPASPSVATGSTTSVLSVVAIGPPTPTYQWQKGGVNLANGGVYSGVTTATLTLTNLTGVDAGTYRAVATNSAGSTNSANAVLTVTGNSAPVITAQPVANQTVATGATVTFNVTAVGTPAPTFQWQKGGAPLADGGIVSGATSSTLTLTGVSVLDSGTYTVVVTSAGSPPPATSTNAVLTVTAPPPPPPPPSSPGTTVAPSITSNPTSQSVTSGANVSFSVSADGTPSPSFQWRRNGIAIAGATSTTLTLTGVTKADAGTYSAVATNDSGTATSTDATLTVSVPSRLINVSTRTISGPGSQTLILGFIINGGSKSLVMRAVGPGLIPVAPNLAGSVLTDPQLVINDGSGVVQSNDNWGGAASLRNAFASVGAFPLVDTSLDAAIAANLNPKAYTALIPSATSGVVLSEVYDADTSEAPAGRLINVSGRAQVGTGDNVLIVGFIIRGDTSKQILIRAIGPELNTQFGVPGALMDPQLDLHQGSTILQHNDDWGGGTALTTAFSQAGAFALSSPKDAAIVATLPEGVYTVVVSGVGNTSGVALVEVYELP